MARWGLLISSKSGALIGWRWHSVRKAGTRGAGKSAATVGVGVGSGEWGGRRRRRSVISSRITSLARRSRGIAVIAVTTTELLQLFFFLRIPILLAIIKNDPKGSSSSSSLSQKEWEEGGEGKKKTQSRLMAMGWPTWRVSPSMIMMVMIIMNLWMRDEQSPVPEFESLYRLIRKDNIISHSHACAET